LSFIAERSISSLLKPYSMSKIYLGRHLLLMLLYSLCSLVVFSQPVPRWVSRYTGAGNMQDVPQSMTIDDAGNVYVTGLSEGERSQADFITLKYDATGKQLWAKRFNSRYNLQDGATGIVTDQPGNVYVTGWSYSTENSIVFTTIKYNRHGSQMWVKHYAAPNGSRSIAYSIRQDGHGNVYVTGSSIGAEGNDDYLLIKYDQAGNELWVRRYNSPENGVDVPYSLAVNTAGHIYVTGSSYESYATLKYDRDGHLLWSRRYSGPGLFPDAAKKIVLDKDGNAYVTGESFDPVSNYDIATIKYAPDGTELWARRYNSSQNLREQGFSLALDASNNVYVIGLGDVNNWGDYLTIKYDAAGNEQWVRRYQGTTTLSSEVPANIVVDPAGNSYVTGSSRPQDGNSDFATIAYDASGNELWVAKYDDDPGSEDEANAIALDAKGNLYITGQIHRKDIALVQYYTGLDVSIEAVDQTLYLGYRPNCTNLSARVSNGVPPYSYQWNHSMATTAKIFVCPEKTTTYTVTVTDASGKTASAQMEVKVIDVRCQNGKVIVCHQGVSLCLPIDMVEAHLAHGDRLGNAQCKNSGPVKTFEITIAPNPFSNSTVIEYEVPAEGHVFISIFDSRGNLIALPVNVWRLAGIYTTRFNASHLPPGIYFYRATLVSKSGTQWASGKMIKTR
jgi:hypothetical protein